MERMKKPFYKRLWFILIIIIVIITIVSSIKEEIKDIVNQKSTYTWPDGILTNMISAPDSEYGRINIENDGYFSIDIYKMTKAKYEEYVKDCESKGFTVDYIRQDDYYSAENEAGYSLHLSYSEKEKTLSISLREPVKVSMAEEQKEESSKQQKENEAMPEGGEPGETEEFLQTIDTESEIENTEEELSEGVRIEFKEMLDSYEAFMDKYCEFMKKYAEADSEEVISMTKDYIQLLEEEAEWIEKIDNMENEEMNAVETKYYAEVTLRVTQKLLDVAQ